MKVLERVLEQRIRCQVSIANMQFGWKGNHWCHFYHATSTRETPSKEEEAVLCFCGGFRVPREVVRCALRKLGVDEWLIRTVMTLYTEACTVVRTDAGQVKVLK